MSDIKTVQTISIRNRLLERIRFFNRRYFNPFAMSFAGRPCSFWSVLYHKGRRSGDEYATPIFAVRQEDHFIIPLPYGQHTDWFRNVMTAGSCRVIFRGRVFYATEPEIISAEEGLGAFSGLVYLLLRRSDTEAFLRLNKISDDQDSEARYKAFTASHPLDRGLWLILTVVFLAVGIGRLLRKRRG